MLTNTMHAEIARRIQEAEYAGYEEYLQRQERRKLYQQEYPEIIYAVDRLDEENTRRDNAIIQEQVDAGVPLQTAFWTPFVRSGELEFWFGKESIKKQRTDKILQYIEEYGQQHNIPTDRTELCKKKYLNLITNKETANVSK